MSDKDLIALFLGVSEQITEWKSRVDRSIPDSLAEAKAAAWKELLPRIKPVETLPSVPASDGKEVAVQPNPRRF